LHLSCVSEKLDHKWILALYQLVESAIHHNTPFSKQYHTVRKEPRSVNIVRYHDGCQLSFRFELHDQLDNLTGCDRVETGGRLVEKQDVGIERQGAGQSHTLLHSAG